MKSDSIKKEGAAMTATSQQRSELAHRSTDGIEVSLYWSKRTNRVTIELVDWRVDERLEFEVARDKALDAFHHPYAYAPVQALDALVVSREAVQT
jgi:hypothetical protein